MTTALNQDQQLITNTAWRIDSRRLINGATISALGSAISTGALGIVAVISVHASAFEVSLLVALGSGASAVLALGAGGLLRRASSVRLMVGMDLVRGLALASVPVAYLLGVLSLAQLYIVSVLQVAATVLFSAANESFLRWFAPGADSRLHVQSRLEGVSWLSGSVGPVLGGALAALMGPVLLIGMDAVSFLASAACVSRVRRVHGPSREERKSASSVRKGCGFILQDRDLRLLLMNAIIFGGCVMAAAPLITVLILADMHMSTIALGIVLGVPALGGFAGVKCSPYVIRQFGVRRVLLASGSLRCVWLWLLVFAAANVYGVALVTVSEFLCLFFAGLFGPAFALRRADLVPLEHAGTCSVGWSVGTKVMQPIFIVAGGVASAIAGTRFALFAVGLCLMLSIVTLPRWSAKHV